MQSKIGARLTCMYVQANLALHPPQNKCMFAKGGLRVNIEFNIEASSVTK